MNSKRFENKKIDLRVPKEKVSLKGDVRVGVLTHTKKEKLRSKG